MKKQKIKLEEGEVICKKCNGEEYIGKDFRICPKCNGLGKLDWITDIMGKKSDCFSTFTNPENWGILE